MIITNQRFYRWQLFYGMDRCFCTGWHGIIPNRHLHCIPSPDGQLHRTGRPDRVLFELSSPDTQETDIKTNSFAAVYFQ